MPSAAAHAGDLRPGPRPVLALLPPAPRAPAPPVYRPAWDARPTQIDLGTCVRVALSGGRARSGMSEEGVVREVVPPGALPVSLRAVPARPRRSPVVRYVVQCWTCRVLRGAAQMIVVAL